MREYAIGFSANILRNKDRISNVVDFSRNQMKEISFPSDSKNEQQPELIVNTAMAALMIDGLEKAPSFSEEQSSEGNFFLCGFFSNRRDIIVISDKLGKIRHLKSQEALMLHEKMKSRPRSYIKLNLQQIPK